jgi:hypothetical protein
MDWPQVKDYLDQCYDFFGRMDASESATQEPVPIHPLLRMSAGLALKAISGRSRLAILFPNRLQCARWIAALCTLEIMKEDYESGPNSTKFSKGQKLLVNRCIVEFVGKEFSQEYNRWYMWIRCKDGALNRIPLDRALAFQPIDTSRPLSSLEAVGTAISSAQSLENPTDNILGTRTMGNKALFTANVILVSRIGETERFIRQNCVNGASIIDLLLWGKLNAEGEVSIIGHQQIQANPSCLLSADLFGALQYIQYDSEKTKGIIIDGSSNYVNDLQILDEILDRKIPAVVVCDLLDTGSLEYLAQRGFRIWQWNRKNIVQSNSIVETQMSSLFSSLNSSISYYCDQKIDLIPCECPELDTAVEETIKLGRFLPSDHQQLNILYGKIIQLTNELSRLIRVPEHTWTAGFLQRLQLLEQQFKSEQLWLSDKAIQCLDVIFGILSEFMKEPLGREKSKAERLYELINDTLESDVLCIIVAKTEEMDESLHYWRNSFTEQKLANIHFTTLSDLLDSDGMFTPTHIVVCGWLGGDRMYQLFHSHIAPEFTILSYSFEQKWFTSASRSWTKRNSYSIHAKNFCEMLGLPEHELKSIEFKAEEPVEPITKEEFDIIEFELRIRTSRYRGYASSTGIQEETCRAKLLIFTRNRFAFITESHRLPVVTDVMKGEVAEGEIHRKYVHELRAGDYVLFQESNRDIIREIADSGLAKEGHSHLRKIAGLWREALREAYFNKTSGFEELVQLLRKVGCKRLPTTIRNWLYDDNQIGPGKKRDLRYIAQATNNKLLLSRLEEVEFAISAVRGAHIQASNYLRSQLLGGLPKIVEGERKLPGYSSESIQLNLGEFGQVTILRIEEIADDWEEIPVNSVNQLLSEED